MLKETQPVLTRWDHLKKAVIPTKRVVKWSLIIAVFMAMIYSPFPLREWCMRSMRTNLYMEKIELVRYDDLFHRNSEKKFDVAGSLREEAKRIARYQESVEGLVWLETMFDAKKVHPEAHDLWFDNWALIEMQTTRGEKLAEREQRGYQRIHHPPKLFDRSDMEAPRVAADQQ